MRTNSSSHPYARHLWIAASLALLLTIGLGWILMTDAWPWLRGPGRWPPSWRWLYVPLEGYWSNGKGPIHMGLLLAYVVAVAVLQFRQATPANIRAGLVLAVLFTFIWQLAQTWVREQSLLDTLIFRTYAPSLNSYFLAPAQAKDIGWMLNNYAEAMPGFFGDKPETHPPGLVLFYLVFQRLFEALPGVSSWFAPIARGWAIEGRDWPLLADLLISSAFVTSWIQVGLTSLTPVTVYLALGQLGFDGWGRKKEDRNEWALFSAQLMPLIPPLTIFLLQWDTVFPLFGFAAWFFALRGQNRLARADHAGLGPWLDWLWAGLLLSLLTWMSFGNLVYGLMIGLHVLWREGISFWQNRTRFDPALLLALVGGLALMGLAVVLPWLLAYLRWDMNFFQLMDIAMAGHYRIVTEQRNYQIWLWMNLVDFGLWLGPGILLLGIVGSVGSWRRAGRGEGAIGWDLAGLALIYWSLLLLLNLSGSTRGEVGRIWIFLMPYPVLLAASLPWSRIQRLLILVIMLWGWVLSYSLAPFLCC